MAVYKFELQLRIPWVDGPQSFYYWLNRSFFNVGGIYDYDTTRDRVLDTAARMSNEDVRLDWLRVTNMSTGIIVQNSSISWPANTLLAGPYSAVENTVYVGKLIASRQVGYNRWRSPVRTEDLEGNRLTSSALSYYRSVMDGLLLSDVSLCVESGAQIEQVVVSPLVHSWQMRHGTKRAAKRALH